MTFPIDPSRRSGPARRPRKKSAAEIVDDIESGRAPYEASGTTLPVPVSAPRTIPAGTARASGDAAIHAQVLGEKRGLRAGPTIHDQAKATYNKTEWSGARDRRRPKGGTTKTEA
jgi:hypothetical protein